MNIYTIIALILAAAILFHMTSVEEMVMLSIAAVVIVYLLKG